VGKTWLACVLGQQACRDNAPVVCKRAARLFSELELGHGPSRQIAAQSPAGQRMATIRGCFEI
jgi:DNA replication protein DnaC